MRDYRRSLQNNTILALIFLALCGAFQIAGADSYVLTASNKATGNSLLQYLAHRDGTFVPAGEFMTEGLGTAGGIGSQGGIVGTRTERGLWLIVVNPGSNDLSLFRYHNHVPHFASKVSSGGVQPVSVTAKKDVVYVVNGGDSTHPANISGFRISAQGELVSIPGSSLPLSADQAGPAQIEFSPLGFQLVVTEKATNKISLYHVSHPSGLAHGPMVWDSVGLTPFGFEWTENNSLVVSEAFGGMDSAVSSYRVRKSGTLETISASVDANDERAACWIAISPNNKIALTTNTATNSISSYKLKRNKLVLVSARALETDPGPIDLAIAEGGSSGFVLNAGGQSIQSFDLNQDSGELALRGGIGSLPGGTFGLVVLRN